MNDAADHGDLLQLCYRPAMRVTQTVCWLGLATTLACTPNMVSVPPIVDDRPTPRPDLPGGDPPGSPPGSCAVPAPQAVPVLPRTSTHEVQQLVADLLGAPVDAALFARWTPLAQVRGFDTMTESRIDAQTLEEQLLTTETVAAALVQSPAIMAICPMVVPPTPLCTVHASYDATTQFSGVQNQDCWSYLDSAGTPLSFDAANTRWVAADPGLFIWNTGLHPGINIDVIRRFTAPLDGAMVLQGSIGDGDGGGGDGITVEVRAPSGTVFRAVIVNGGASESFDVPLDVHRGDVIDIVVQRGVNNSYDTTALTASFAFAPTLPADGLSWENCGYNVVERVASRAWRRPLGAAEMDDLKSVFDVTTASAAAAGLGAFFEGLQTTLQAALLSPNVQYKPEFVPGGFDATQDSHRRASRLALYFRSSFPDDELWALAQSGAFAGDNSDELLRAQAERLLAQQGDRFVQNFAGQWLNFRGLIGVPDEPLQASMRREAHDVFAAILADNLPPQRLIAPGFTVVDAALGAHYGLAVDAQLAGPQRVVTNERGGLFSQGHFLASSATGSDFQRVIHRGIFTLNRTLCSSVPMLDPATREEIANSVGQIDPTMPLGDRMEAHRGSSERCLGCHSQMDPLGLALENFDASGRWRDSYPDGSAIDNGFDFNGTSVRNPGELAAYVGGSDEFRRCVAEKLFTFGLHRAVRDEESCLIAGLVDSAADEPTSLHDITIDAFLTSLHLTEQP
jgi:hypothetical protein